MTTVVFPGAFKKFYLDASVEERTRRRTAELTARGYAVDETRIRDEITDRDARDSGRDIAPLRKAEDACYIDSTGLQKEEVFRKIMRLVKGVGSKKARAGTAKNRIQ
jgi:cytidylate kinase